MDFRDLGAIIGFVSGALVLIDRYYKGRPIVSVSTVDDSGLTRVCIRITNITPYDIAIIGNYVQPNVYFLSETLEVRDLITSQTRSPQILLKPQQSKDFFIAPRFQNGVALELEPRYVEFWIFWRRGNATWLKQVPL